MMQTRDEEIKWITETCDKIFHEKYAETFEPVDSEMFEYEQEVRYFDNLGRVLVINARTNEVQLWDTEDEPNNNA